MTSAEQERARPKPAGYLTVAMLAHAAVHRRLAGEMAVSLANSASSSFSRAIDRLAQDAIEGRIPWIPPGPSRWT